MEQGRQTMLPLLELRKFEPDPFFLFKQNTEGL